MALIKYRLKTAALLLLLAVRCAVAAEPAAQFEDVTKAVGLTGLANSQAAWGDYNNDGWVDLYVGGQLWRNEAGKGFTKVDKTPLAGIGIWGDYDNDGYLDLFCWSIPARLYHNEKGKGFTALSGQLPKLPMKVSSGAVWGDFDNDGFLDLYVGGYEAEAARLPQADAILLNNRQGRFLKVLGSVRGQLQPSGCVSGSAEVLQKPRTRERLQIRGQEQPGRLGLAGVVRFAGSR